MVTKRGREKDKDLERKLDRGVFPGVQGGPHEASIAGIAVALGEAGKPEYREYIKQVVKNAGHIAKLLHDYGFQLTTGGTDNHLMVVDLRNKRISGKEAAVRLEGAGIITNYNAVPHDTNLPTNPSGIRIGTPAVTTRGMGEEEMKLIATYIDEILNSKSEILNKSQIQKIKNQVEDLCRKFPVPR